MSLFGLKYYFWDACERLGLVDLVLVPETLINEKRWFDDFKINWDWYNIPGSLFGEDYFPSVDHKPVQNQKNFIKAIPDILTSNYDVIYNSCGANFIRKEKPKPALVRV